MTINFMVEPMKPRQKGLGLLHNQLGLSKLSCKTQHRLGHIWSCAMKMKEELLPPGFLQRELQ